VGGGLKGAFCSERDGGWVGAALKPVCQFIKRYSRGGGTLQCSGGEQSGQ